MLTHLIILLDDTSVSYCHYDVTKTERRLIDLDVLKGAIVWGMKENLNIQFVYPDYELPEEYRTTVETIDNTKIKPLCQAEDADVLVLNGWDDVVPQSSTCILRTTRKDLDDHLPEVNGWLGKAARLNIVLTDMDEFSDDDIEDYKVTLDVIAGFLAEHYSQQHTVQLNLLTDRIFLTKMNNCDAGAANVTLAPNGKFYLCPAFYYADEEDCIGDLHTGLDIKNQQLLRLDHAPICRHCDAYQCRRCIWMNSRLTMDANTPSHQQCVVAHLERNASRVLLMKLEKYGLQISNSQPIEEMKELDPFNSVNRWK